MSIVVHYRGSPRPIRSLWGDVGFEELTNGALVAGQPNGAASWFPCDDHPSAKASYRIQISADNPYRVVANGKLVSRRRRAAQTDLDLRATRTDVDLPRHPADRDVRGASQLTTTPVPMHAALPERLRRNFDHDFARQPEMMELFVELFGPYPLANGYAVVVTDDALEIPLEAQGVSIFGANHCDGSRSQRAARCPRAGPPVVRQLGDGAAVARHLAARGIRLLRGVVVVGAQRRTQRRRPGPPLPRRSCAERRRICC